MTNIQMPVNYVPRAYQRPIWKALQDGQKRIFMKWPRRHGKDFTCMSILATRAVQKPGAYYYFFPKYSQGRKVIWEGQTEPQDGSAPMKFLDAVPAEFIKRKSNQDMVLELTNGSIIRVVGTDNIDTVRGTNPIFCIFSEFAEMTMEVWDVMRPVLAENGGVALFNGTPKGYNHMYDMYIMAKQNPAWHVSEVQCVWPEKEFYTADAMTPEKVQAERDAGMSEQMVAQELGCSFNANITGAYYGEVIEKAFEDGRVGNYPYDYQYPVDTFWDLGYQDPTVIWFRQTIGSAIIWIDYYEAQKVQFHEIVQELRNRGYSYRTHYIPHDGARISQQTGLSSEKMIQDLCRQYGVNDYIVSLPKPHSPLNGIRAVLSRFSRYHFNRETVDEALRKLSLYHAKWDPKKRIFLDARPVHDYTSHTADALRLDGESMAYEDPYSIQDIPHVSGLDYDPLGDM